MSKKKDERDPLKELLWPGQSVELLKALHILTRDGALNADSRRKLKQVLHLVQLLRPTLDRLFDEGAVPRLADLGAGKSYLGFILYDLIFGPKGRGEVIAVEARDALMGAAKELASASGFDRMSFVAGAIGDASLNQKVDMVTALHACDTATDDAIRFALKHEARVVALVPCCPAEVARLLEGEAVHGNLPAPALLADTVFDWDTNVGQEQLSKVGLAGDLPNWSPFDARSIHRSQ